jgi:hypothetical protein
MDHDIINLNDINHDMMYGIVDQAYDIIVHENAYDINNDMHYEL